MAEAYPKAGIVGLEARWDAIRAKLEAASPSLLAQGTLVDKKARGRRDWAVRYLVEEGGRCVHKSIYVGGDKASELIERVRRLLEWHRVQGKWASEVEAHAQLTARAGGVLRRMEVGRRRSR
ncbi:hypothetical protein [Paludisphaera mucosa]|uniref:Uncharacterized protein n=1 Tax=Paludisphaera mucosa TaxID=3030827 RepID=A0ABT6FD18_9BACT|nr:hypothetical protein [Paludisphaera mucosa]MDG3005475.1 hypothetical protein [Paludisphaera mucosa]